MARQKDLNARHHLRGDVRGRGLLIGIELVRDRESKQPANEAAESVLYRALSKQLSFKTTMGNVLTLTPSLTITAAEMEVALGIIEECIDEVERDEMGL